MNLNKLKGKLRECGKNYKSCADYIGISLASFNNKINGRSKFYIDELDKLGDYLDMSAEEKGNIFLH